MCRYRFVVESALSNKQTSLVKFIRGINERTRIFDFATMLLDNRCKGLSEMDFLFQGDRPKFSGHLFCLPVYTVFLYF